MPPPIRRAALLLVAALAGAGCGGETRGGAVPAGDGGAAPDPATPPSPLLAPEQSGTKITLRVWDGGNGATETRYAWDESHGVECAPQVAADGRVRCLPSSSGHDLFFRDATCTQPLIPSLDATCTPSARFVVDAPESVCPPAVAHVYERGAAVDAPPRLYRRLFGFCLPQQSTGAGQQLFDGVESKAEDWVAFEHDTVPVTSTLGVSSWKGDDGSRLADGLVLLPDGVPCEPSSYSQNPATPAILRCLPTARAAEGQSSFLDDTCTTHLTTAPSCRPAELVARVGPATQCGSPADLFEIDHELPLSAVHEVSGASCSAVAPALLGEDHYYATGKALADDRYPRLSIVHAGTGRLHQEYLASEGKTLMALGIFDAKRRTACTSVALPDGTTGCISNGELASFNGDYADASCTEPVASVACPRSGQLPRAVIVNEPTTKSCASPDSALRSLGSTYTGPVYSKNGGACHAGQRNDGDTYYQVGAPVSPESLFAALTAATL